MNGLVFHLISGEAFFSGLVFVGLGIGITRQANKFLRRLSPVLLVLGILLVGLSTTPIPYWLYGLLTALTVTWLIVPQHLRWRRWVLLGAGCGWFVAGVLEIPYLFVPVVAPVPTRSLTIIGDSVTAGVGEEDGIETWPKIIAREHRLNVQDLSKMGATTDSAFKRVRTLKVDSPVVWLEIGGNDLLGSTTPAQYQEALESLLSHLAQPDRQIVMFELPLPPLCHDYGRVQRVAAVKHGVKLIPKRIFLSVLASGGSTLDSIHLSQEGHHRMAETVWGIIHTAYAP